MPLPAAQFKHRLVKIVWKDAFAGPQGWVSLEDYRTEPALPITIGWLLEGVLEGYVTTADTYLEQDGETTYYNIGHIPIEMVISMDILELEEAKLPRKSKKGGK